MSTNYCSVCCFIRTDMSDGVCRHCRELSLQRICNDMKIEDCQN